MTSRQARAVLSHLALAPGWALHSEEDPKRQTTIFTLTHSDGRTSHLGVTDVDLMNASSPGASIDNIMSWVEGITRQPMGHVDFAYGGGGGVSGGTYVGPDIVNGWGNVRVPVGGYRPTMPTVAVVPGQRRIDLDD